MTKTNLIDPSAGRVLVKVVCDGCGNRTVAVVQEHDAGGGRRMASYFGKVPDARGLLIGARPLADAEDVAAMLLLCPRHGVVRVPPEGSSEGARRAGPRVMRAEPVA